MKLSITFLFFFISISLFSQEINQLGLTDDPVLTLEEAQYFMQHMSEEQRQGIDLTNKKVLFVTGSSGGRLISKSTYFKNITPKNETNNIRGSWIFELTEKEKINSGGYDIFITHWCKTILNSNRKRHIKTAAKTEQMSLLNK